MAQFISGQVEQSSKEKFKSFFRSLTSKRIFGLLSILLLMVALPFTVYISLQRQSIKQQAAENQSPITLQADATKVSTLQTLTLNSIYQQEIDSGKKQQAKQRLETFVKERKQKLLVLIETNPQAFLFQTISNKMYQQFSSETQQYLEKEVTIEGTYGEFHYDDFKNKKATYFRLIKTNTGEKIYIYFTTKDSPHYRSGLKVKIHGIRLENKLVIPSIMKDFVITAKPSEVLGTVSNKQILGAKTTSTKKALIILFNFNDDASKPLPLDKRTIYNAVFTDTTSVKNFVSETSYDTMMLEGSIYGTYTIPIKKDCTTDDISYWETLAKKEAGREVNVSAYDYVIYYATLCNDSRAGGVFSSDNPTELFVNGYYINSPLEFSKVVSHEFGHILGVNHAGTETCFDANNNRISISANCSKNEVGDPFDVMGNTGGYNHYSGYRKEQFHFPITTETVTTNGTYTLYNPIETFSSNVEGIKIPLPSGLFYYLEYRRPFGFDKFGFGDPVTNGVSIRQAIANDSWLSRFSYLLDSTPNSNKDNDFIDSALTIGKTFTDSVNGITITTKSITNITATVDIAFGGITCGMHMKPSVELSPQSQWGFAGQEGLYTLLIHNNDVSGCPKVTFSVYPHLPSGWTQTPVDIITLAPGEEKQISLKIISSKEAKPSDNGEFKETISLGSGDVPVDITGNYNILPKFPTAIITSPQMVGRIVNAGLHLPITFNATAQSPDGYLTKIIIVATQSNNADPSTWGCNNKQGNRCIIADSGTFSPRTAASIVGTWTIPSNIIPGTVFNVFVVASDYFDQTCNGFNIGDGQSTSCDNKSQDVLNVDITGAPYGRIDFSSTTQRTISIYPAQAVGLTAQTIDKANKLKEMDILVEKDDQSPAKNWGCDKDVIGTKWCVIGKKVPIVLSGDRLTSSWVLPTSVKPGNYYASVAVYDFANTPCSGDILYRQYDGIHWTRCDRSGKVDYVTITVNAPVAVTGTLFAQGNSGFISGQPGQIIDFTGRAEDKLGGLTKVDVLMQRSDQSPATSWGCTHPLPGYGNTKWCQLNSNSFSKTTGRDISFSWNPDRFTAGTYYISVSAYNDRNTPCSGDILFNYSGSIWSRCDIHYYNDYVRLSFSTPSPTPTSAPECPKHEGYCTTSSGCDDGYQQQTLSCDVPGKRCCVPIPKTTPTPTKAVCPYTCGYTVDQCTDKFSGKIRSEYFCTTGYCCQL